jgi:predicted enzyme related to lactoylglutathione lyase
VATRTKYEHGVFSWTTLSTPDPAAAKRFYGGVFGWQFEDMPAGPEQTYTFARMGKESVAGLSGLTKEMIAQGVPTHWMPFVNVTNADDVAKKATQSGGKVPYPPMDVLTVGRMALLEDPTGAKVAIWQAKEHAGADRINETGAMCWDELMTPNTAAAAQFYKATFGWAAEEIEMGGGTTYTMFKVGDKQVGGMMARPPRLKDVPPHWLTYFSTPNVDDTTKKVTSLGGKVIQPPTDVPNIGRFAVCQDPQNAVFALFTPTS